ncbi:MAG: Hpt domain-containing protein, partial [Dokdonella sp.]|nr:Hpt domain-containing protein [Dokdonella sp.]
MKLYDDGAFTALSWVKPALDATLAQASEALERHVEDPGQAEPLRECAHCLHQVQGTLRMVELYGAAMVVENMERIADSLLADSIRQRDEAYSVLMRGMVQLPDYLERLQSGHKDIPIVLLPLLNDLRAVLGENLLSESALFSPDMGAPLPGSAAGAAAPLAAADLRAQTLRLRLAFQAALLKWFRDESAAEHVRRLTEVLDRLRQLSHEVEPRRLWWAAAGMAECIAEGGLGASAAVKLLLGRVDREIHRLAESGEAAFAAKSPRELVKNLLYYVAQADAAKVTSRRVADIRNVYHLDALLPTSAELQHAQGSMAGRNRALLDTVAGAIKDDLLRVKEALDIFLRGQNSDAHELSAQAEMLNRVGDTLGMLGLGVPRRVVGEQRDVLEQMGRGQRAVDEGALLDVAGALLYVEASLDDHIERLGEAPGEEEAAGELTLPKAESRRVLEALIREASVNLQQAKQDIIAFVESPWDHARVVRIPELLDQIAGALRMLDLADAGALVTAVVHFVRTELLIHRRVPTTEQMDKLADALTAIEYYLEATREHRRNREAILDVARDSLQGLGYWPLSVAEARAAETSNLASIPQATLVRPEAALERSDARADVAAKPHIVVSPEPQPVVPMPIVEVLPGKDLGDLVVGQTRPLEPESHDVTGLKLSPTEPSAPTPAASEEDGNWVDVEEEVEEPVAAKVEYLPVGFTAKAGDEIDDDIREIFLEEVSEEISNLTQQVPHWKADTANLDQLTPIRRSFHTLKGSGRLVGATALGEFSWKVENMLNRVLDRSIAPGPVVVDIIDRALASVQDLLGALRGKQVDAFRVNAIMDTADRLAAGEDAQVPDAPAAGSQIVRRTVRRFVPAPKPVAPVIEQHAPLEVERAFGEPTSPLITPSPLPTIDPVLLDILQTEVASHVRSIDEFLAEADPHAAAVTEPLLRAVHTFHGAVVTVQISQLCNVLAPLETYVKHLRAAQEPIPAQGMAVLRDTSALAREVMDRLATNTSPLPDSSELAARAVQLRDAVPEPPVSMPWYTDGSELALTDEVTTPESVPAAEPEAEPEAAPATSSELSFGELDEITNQAVAAFTAEAAETHSAPAAEAVEFEFEEPAAAHEEITLDSTAEAIGHEEVVEVEPQHEPVESDLPAAALLDQPTPVAPAEVALP